MLFRSGQAFDAVSGLLSLYTEDDYHPSQVGSLLAAQVIAEKIRELSR